LQLVDAPDVRRVVTVRRVDPRHPVVGIDPQDLLAHNEKPVDLAGGDERAPGGFLPAD